MADPPLDPDAIAHKTFLSGFRGYEQQEVRAYLHDLAQQARRVRDRLADAEARLAEIEPLVRDDDAAIDPSRLTELVGEETARVLEAARSAADEITGKAEDAAARVVREATAEAQALRNAADADAREVREEADGVLAERRAEAEAAAAEIIARAERDAATKRDDAEADRLRALEEAERTRDDAAVEAERLIAETKAHGRAIVAEARALRRRVLTDLGRRRHAARAQVARLDAGRERLLAAYDAVRGTLDEATGELTTVVGEARAAADTAALRVSEEPIPTAEELEAELDAAVDADLLDEWTDDVDLEGDVDLADESGIDAAGEPDPFDDDPFVDSTAGSDHRGAAAGEPDPVAAVDPADAPDDDDSFDVIDRADESEDGDSVDSVDPADAPDDGDSFESADPAHEIELQPVSSTAVPEVGTDDLPELDDDLEPSPVEDPPDPIVLPRRSGKRRLLRREPSEATLLPPAELQPLTGRHEVEGVRIVGPTASEVVADEATHTQRGADDHDEAGGDGGDAGEPARHADAAVGSAAAVGEAGEAWSGEGVGGGAGASEAGGAVGEAGEGVGGGAGATEAGGAVGEVGEGVGGGAGATEAGGAVGEVGGDGSGEGVGGGAGASEDGGAVGEVGEGVGGGAGASEDGGDGSVEQVGGGADGTDAGGAAGSGDGGAVGESGGAGASEPGEAGSGERVGGDADATEAGAADDADGPVTSQQVDELFARIRADRAKALGEAHEVLDASDGGGEVAPSAGDEAAESPDGVAAADEAGRTGAPESDATAESDQIAASNGAGDPEAAPADHEMSGSESSAAGPPGAGDEETGAMRVALVALTERDEALDPLAKELGRRLKRALADEQNELLDAIRRAGDDDVLAQLPDARGHASSYITAAGSVLAEAADAGGASVTTGESFETPDTSVIARHMAEAICLPLRDRFERAREEAAGDTDELDGRLRAVYREWKSTVLVEAGDDALVAAFSAGVVAGTPAGCGLRWLVAPGSSPCPDAEDNALGGVLAPGDEFPTGDLAPPAHPGCRCLVVPATQ